MEFRTRDPEIGTLEETIRTNTPNLRESNAIINNGLSVVEVVILCQGRTGS